MLVKCIVNNKIYRSSCNDLYKAFEHDIYNHLVKDFDMKIATYLFLTGYQFCLNLDVTNVQIDFNKETKEVSIKSI